MKKLLLLCSLLIIAGYTSVVYSAEQNPNVDEAVLISGVRWATRNVGAPGTFVANPEDAGLFFRWNNRRGWDTAASTSGWTYSSQSGNAWHRNNDPCPPGWRIPVDDEMRVLRYTTMERTTRNGVAGVLLGNAPNQIFLPATGWLLQDDGRHTGAGVTGYYWSNGRTGSGRASYLGFNRNSLSFSRTNRAYGFSVRCVVDEESNPFIPLR